MLWQVSTTCLLAVAVLGSLDLVSGKLEALPAGWMEKDPRVKHVQGMAHTTVEEIVKELKQEQASQMDGLRFKRDLGGEPVVEGMEELTGLNPQDALIAYIGELSNVIIVLLIGRNGETDLYRSTDFGASFIDIKGQLDPNDTDPTLWQRFTLSPTNSSMVVFPHATQSKIYYSMDAGDTWSIQEFTPNTINPRTLKWNPTEDDWILGHDNTNDQLYVTQDLGETWIKIADYVDRGRNFRWGIADVDSNASTVFFNVYDPNDASRGDFTADLYTQRHPYTDVTLQNFDPNLGRHDAFLMRGPYIFAQKTDSEAEISLLVSYNREPFNKALIPSTLPHVNYFVAQINFLQAAVAVEHSMGQLNLYSSDITGVYYSLSLPDVVFGDSVQNIELQRIRGLNGTAIANQYVREDPSESNPPVRTLISLDNGGTWEPLRAPTDAANPCELPLCSLHFHMDTSEYARLGVYSEASAPGIIVAHGTAGTELSDDPDLYISRDGGISWEKTLNSSWGVSILDHGGLIVAARDYHQEISNEIMYTCDEGISWQSFVFLGSNNSNITVFGVVTEPGEITTTVSLYGVENFRQPGALWIVVTINFTDIFPRICNDSDYYNWMPWDGRLGGDLCLLGSSITIQRRRAEVCCLNQREYVREFDFQICNCTARDFECDYGYKRALGTTGPCIRDTDLVIPDPCANDDGATYDKTTGYRRIPGDVCEDGDESIFLPYPATCLASSSERCSTDDEEEGAAIVLAIFFVLAIGAAVILLIVVIILSWKLYKLRPKSDFQPPPVETFSYGKMSATESASDTTAIIEGEEIKTPIPQC